jgi:hypothetical protein
MKFTCPAKAFVCFVTLLLGSCLAAAGGYPDIAPDGSCNLNTQWENGQSPVWYIELQRVGDYAILQGIQTENESYIQAGISALKWGMNKQGATGAFTGTGDPFHSTCLFVEATANTLMALRNYHPQTYTANYSATVKEFIPMLQAACTWLTSPSVLTAGLASDAAFNHRRYLLGDAIGETAYLAGNAANLAYSQQFIQDGLNEQWPNGVDPESYGYDVGYQMVSTMFAQHYLPICTNPTMTAALYQMIERGLAWETTRIDSAGDINISGSTRTGTEKNRNGTVKQISRQQVMQVFQTGYQEIGDIRFLVALNEVRGATYPNEATSFLSTGAVGTNSEYADGKTPTYDVSLQTYGSDWLEDGLGTLNNSKGQDGALILNWAIGQQNGSGAFGSTVHAAHGAADIADALFRSSTNAYNYGPLMANSTSYLIDYAAFEESALIASKWLNSAEAAGIMAKEDVMDTSHEWLFAADLARTAAILQNGQLQISANRFAGAAMMLQLGTGENPEDGKPSGNAQALGMLYAAEYYDSSNDPAMKDLVRNSLSMAANYLFTLLLPDGTIKATDGTPANYMAIAAAMAAAYRITGDPKASVGYYWVIYQRPSLPYWIGSNDTQMAPIAGGTI